MKRKSPTEQFYHFFNSKKKAPRPKKTIIQPTFGLKSCVGKYCYLNITHATQEMLILQESIPDKYFTIYECPVCQAFHIGSNKITE